MPVPTIPTPDGRGAVAHGRIVLGYGARDPIAGQDLWVDGLTESGEDAVPSGRTDASGHFVLTGLAVGEHRFGASHLQFRVVVTASDSIVDLGLLKYPLVHPPNAYWWEPSALPSLAVFESEGSAVDFVTCFEDADWRRPSPDVQGRTVWSRAPFVDEDPDQLESWFAEPARLFTGWDLFSQSPPGGLDLADLGAEQRYALGLWNAKDPVADSTCAYDRSTLEGLLRLNPVELWLLGYRADSVRRWVRRFDPPVTPRTGVLGGAAVVESEAHFAVYVESAEGFSVIRFAGIDGTDLPFALHLIQGDRELTVLNPLGETSEKD
jgi:hypothetical protein